MKDGRVGGKGRVILINGGEKGGLVSANLQPSILIVVMWVFYDLKGLTDFSLKMVIFIGNNLCLFKAYMVVSLAYMLN